MLRLIAILIGLTLLSEIKAQNLDFWIMVCDTAEPNNCGYIDKSGEIKIPLGKYTLCFSDTFTTCAIVFKPGEGFIGIDKLENKLFTIFTYDNGPDYISEGTFRIIENGKMGIADTSGKIIIKPVYDFIFGFENGLTLVNLGGYKKISDLNNFDGEHFIWEGGLWGVINRQGELILEIKYNLNWVPGTKKVELSGAGEKFELITGKLSKVK